MKALASFILRGQSQAMLVVVGFAVLSLALPPLSILSGAAVALVSLRHGMQAGVVLMAGATLVVGVLAAFSLGNPAPALMFLTALWLPLWMLGSLLRASRSLSLALMLAGGLGLLGVLVVYLLLDDVAGWWYGILLQIFNPVMGEAGLADQDVILATLESVSRVMTGMMAAGMVLNAIICLFLARGWQAQLFNPGGFREEFQQLRMGRSLSGITVLLVLLYVLQMGAISSMAADMLIVLLSLYMLQGLALAHAVVAMKQLHIAWLIGLYVVAFVVLPQLMLAVAAVGLLDTWVDLRRRVAGPGAGGAGEE